MAKRKADRSSTVPDPSPRPAILFEFDNLAIAGREIAFAVAKRVFGAKGVAVTHAVYAQHMLDRPPAAYLHRLLKSCNKTRLSEDKLASELTDGMAKALAGIPPKASPGLKQLLDVAGRRGDALGAFSFHPRATVEAILERCGLGDAGVSPVCVTGGGAASDRDAWLRAAASVSVAPQHCIAIATSARSCAAAVSAGIRTVAVPDLYTSFQDFGGADLVVDEIDGAAVKRILGLHQS